jgi:hypothetical protein
MKQTLERHGVNTRGAKELAAAFDSLEELWKAAPEGIDDIEGVGRKTRAEIEQLYPTVSPLPVEVILGERDSIAVDGEEIRLRLLERPEAVPESAEQRIIEYAERVLEQVPALSRNTDDVEIFHHEDIRRSMEEWARSDESPEDARDVVFSMGPNERNFGRLEAPKDETPKNIFQTRNRKAEIVLAWADNTFAGDTLDDVRDTVDAEHREALEAVAEEKARQRKAEQILNDPPGEINGWTHTTTTHAGFALAFEGWSQGSRLMVNVAYRDDAGDLQVDQFAYPDWIAEADKDPCAIRENKRLSFDDFDTEAGAVAELVSTLEVWSGHPDHDPEEYPTEVNGWLLQYVDEDSLCQIKYVEPGTGETLYAEKDDEDVPWWVQYDDPDGRTTDIWEAEDLADARNMLLEAASRMMAVEGGGSLERHAEIARNLHRVDGDERAEDPTHHEDDDASTPPESAGGWRQPPEHIDAGAPLAVITWTDGRMSEGVYRFEERVSIYREDDGEYRAIQDEPDMDAGETPDEIARERDWEAVLDAAVAWMEDHPPWVSSDETSNSGSGQSPGSSKNGSTQATLL